MSSAISVEQKRRQAWMAALAKAEPGELESAWDQLDVAPEYSWLRQPEFGSTMLGVDSEDSDLDIIVTTFDCLFDRHQFFSKIEESLQS